MNIRSIVTLALVLGSGSVFAECTLPESPSLPDGATAAMKDMIAGQNAVKTFQAANIEYMSCLEKVFTEAEAAALEGTDEEKQASTKIYEDAVDAYNNAVSREEAVAGQFNTEIREFKAANPS